MIYLDNNATTPVAPEVLDAMLPYFTQHYGNPASRQHTYGWIAEEAIDHARAQVAAILNAEAGEICFTSGATEACNLALKGIYTLYQRKGKHIVTIATEHKAVLDTCEYLRTQGAEITVLPVDAQGCLDLDMLRDAIRTDTILVAAMWANNETGVIHPVDTIGAICAEKGTMLFSDATQAVGKISVHPRACGVQLLALSAHKCYGPKGAGALYISRRSPRVKLGPLLHGGGHEEGVRSGTLNVPGIVGLGHAMQLAANAIINDQHRAQEMRDMLERELRALPAVEINGIVSDRLPHVSNLRFDGIDASRLMTALSREIAMASGSACTSANPEPSHVLLAMGLTRDQARASVRLSLGRYTTEDEIELAGTLIAEQVKKLRDLRS